VLPLIAASMSPSLRTGFALNKAQADINSPLWQ